MYAYIYMSDTHTHTYVSELKGTVYKHSQIPEFLIFTPVSLLSLLNSSEVFYSVFSNILIEKSDCAPGNLVSVII